MSRLPKTETEKVAKLESKLKKVKKQHKVACLERDIYAARNELAKDPKNEEKRGIVAEFEQKLDKAKGGLAKNEKDTPQSKAPDIKVSEANGKIGTAPPRSSSGGHSRSRI